MPHLILLIGTNPIPNYVAAMYASKKGMTHFYLVHTLTRGSQQATQDIAECLKQQLTGKGIPQDKIKMVPLQDASNNETIYGDLEKELSSIPADSEIILNYTGGTKAMAVHTYAWLSQKSGNAKFQYLDARTQKIITDSNTEPPSDYLLNERSVAMDSIDTMLKLHGYQSPTMGNDPYPDITKEIAALIANKHIDIFFEMIRKLRLIYYDTKGICVKKKKLTEQLSSGTVRGAVEDLNNLLQSNPFLTDILQLFPQENCILNPDGTVWTPSDSDSNRTVELRTKGCIHEYLDGKWLEYHVLRALKGLADKHGLILDKHFGNSVETIKSSGSKKFELDLFVLRGYQLTAISITTAGESKAKSKAFEVMHRARQIGGDEARGILVANLGFDEETNVDVATEMQTDINFLLSGSISDYFWVIGRDSWEFNKLQEKLEEILWK